MTKDQALKPVIFKLALFGDKGVGKSLLREHYFGYSKDYGEEECCYTKDYLAAAHFCGSPQDIGNKPQDGRDHKES